MFLYMLAFNSPSLAQFDEDFVGELIAVVGQVLKPVDGGDELLEQVFEGLTPVIAKRL